MIISGVIARPQSSLIPMFLASHFPAGSGERGGSAEAPPTQAVSLVSCCCEAVHSGLAAFCPGSHLLTAGPLRSHHYFCCVVKGLLLGFHIVLQWPPRPYRFQQCLLATLGQQKQLLWVVPLTLANTATQVVIAGSLVGEFTMCRYLTYISI